MPSHLIFGLWVENLFLSTAPSSSRDCCPLCPKDHQMNHHHQKPHSSRDSQTNSFAELSKHRWQTQAAASIQRRTKPMQRDSQTQSCIFPLPIQYSNGIRQDQQLKETSSDEMFHYWVTTASRPVSALCCRGSAITPLEAYSITLWFSVIVLSIAV